MRTFRQSLRHFGLCVALGLLTLPLQAQSFTLLNNIQENATYTTVSPGYGDAGMRFFYQASPYRINSVTLPLSQDGTEQNLTLSLHEDIGRVPSGAPLDVFTTDLSELSDTQTNVLFRATFSPVLEAGKSYWLVLSSESEVLWHKSTRGNAGSGKIIYFYRQDNDDWYSQSYMSGIAVSATAVDVYEHSYEPVDYTIFLNGEFYDKRAWNGTANELDLNLFQDELPPGQYQLSIVVEYADGFSSAPVTHDFHIEPGPQHYLLNHHINNSEGEIDDGFVLTDNPNDEITRTTGKDLPPGPYLLVLESSTRFASGTFPTTRSFYIEPNSQRSIPFSTEHPVLILLDENDQVVSSYNLHAGADSLSFERSLSAIELKNLPEDTTYRVALSYPNPQSEAVVDETSNVTLYRQETYVSWIYRMTNNYRYPYQDQDEDGLPNILEWYLKTDPMMANPGLAPEIRSVPEGLEISWVGRGGSTFNSQGQMRFEDIANHFGIEYQKNGDLGVAHWPQGFPYFEYNYQTFSYEFTTEYYTIKREPLAGGQERIRYTLLKSAPGFLDRPLFFRWTPAYQ